MVDIKNLRIGNWIMPNNSTFFNKEYNGKPVMVDEDLLHNLITNPTIQGGVCSYDYIELTDKILENFLFEKNNSNRLVLEINSIFEIGKTFNEEVNCFLYAHGEC